TRAHLRAVSRQHRATNKRRTKERTRRPCAVSTKAYYTGCGHQAPPAAAHERLQRPDRRQTRESKPPQAPDSGSESERAAAQSHSRPHTPAKRPASRPHTPPTLSEKASLLKHRAERQTRARLRKRQPSGH